MEQEEQPCGEERTDDGAAVIHGTVEPIGHAAELERSGICDHGVAR